MPCGQTNGYRAALIMQVSADRSAYSSAASFLTFPMLHRDRWSYLTASRKSRYALAPWHCDLGRQYVCRWTQSECDWGATIHMIRFGRAMYTDEVVAHWQLTICAALPMAQWRLVLLRNLQHRLGITLQKLSQLDRWRLVLMPISKLHSNQRGVSVLPGAPPTH
jgi:hypothetical protein